jgi:hypothetical protein
LPKPSLRTLEQSGKVIPSARQLDPLTRTPTVVGTRFRPAPRSVRTCDGYSYKCGYPQTYVRARFYSLQSVAVGRDPSGARDRVQLKGRVPVSCQILVPRVATRGSSDARSRNCLPSLPYMWKVGQQAHTGSFDHGVTFLERSGVPTSVGRGVSRCHPWVDVAPTLGLWGTTGARLKSSYHDTGDGRSGAP